MTYEICRLCRDKKTIKKLTDEERKYQLPSTKYVTGIDLFTFINDLIKKTDKDYLLICHDDVVFPENIGDNIEKTIKSMDSYVGNINWAVVGNAGIEVLSKRTLRYISDIHTVLIPSQSTRPKLVESLDGNTMLLNIKNIREKKISLPTNIKGFHLYDLILCLESYKKGLVCGVSSFLHVKHLSGGNYESFLEATNSSPIQDYFIKNFKNTIVNSINGEIKINRDYNHLLPNSNNYLISIEDTVWHTISQIFSTTKIKLHILTRLHIPSNKIYRLMESLKILNLSLPKEVELHIHIGANNIQKSKIERFLNPLKKKYNNLNIDILYIPKTKGYPRVDTLKKLVEGLKEEENSYAWIIDYDDYAFPALGKYIQFILKDSEITAGESYVFDENWGDNSLVPAVSVLRHKFPFDLVDYIYTGNSSMPICSVIYKVGLLKEVMKNFNLIGDYYEDYAILLLASKGHCINSFPVAFAGISYHGSNTVTEIDRTHWNYSYSSFMTEVINNNLINPNLSNIYVRAIEENKRLRDVLADYIGFKEGLIWRMLCKYRRIKVKVKKIIKF